VTHVDNTARIQTVDRERNPRLSELLEAFDRLTGCPVLINTSFNIRGEPIVCTAADAYRCFMATNIDVLIVDDFLLLKEQQRGERPDFDAYLAKYGND
jgi:carbamoyltransferase